MGAKRATKRTPIYNMPPLLTDRTERPSCFSNWSDKIRTWLLRYYLASCQFSLNSVQKFQWRIRKCRNPSEARSAIFFTDQPEKKHNVVEDVEILTPVKFSLNSVKWFHSRGRKSSQPIGCQGGHFFRSALKSQTW